MMIQMIHLRDSTGQVKTQKLHTMLTCELLSEKFYYSFRDPARVQLTLTEYRSE